MALETVLESCFAELCVLRKPVLYVVLKCSFSTRLVKIFETSPRMMFVLGKVVGVKPGTLSKINLARSSFSRM